MKKSFTNYLICLPKQSLEDALTDSNLFLEDHDLSHTVPELRAEIKNLKNMEMPIGKVWIIETKITLYDNLEKE